MDKLKEIIKEKRKLMNKSSVILIDRIKLRKVKENRYD